MFLRGKAVQATGEESRIPAGHAEHKGGSCVVQDAIATVDNPTFHRRYLGALEDKVESNRRSGALQNARTLGTETDSMIQRTFDSRHLAALPGALLPELLSGRVRMPEASQAIKEMIPETEVA